MKHFVAQEYPYEVKPAVPVAWGVLCGLGAIAFAFLAMTNDRALNLEHIWLPPEAATVVYWVMCAVCAGVLVMSVHLAIRSWRYPKRLSLSAHSVSIPKDGWSSRLISISYATISDMAEIKVRGQRFLYVTHADGRTIVNSAFFTSEADYDPFYQSLMERVNACRSLG